MSNMTPFSLTLSTGVPAEEALLPDLSILDFPPPSLLPTSLASMPMPVRANEADNIEEGEIFDADLFAHLIDTVQQPAIEEAAYLNDLDTDMDGKRQVDTKDYQEDHNGGLFDAYCASGFESDSEEPAANTDTIHDEKEDGELLENDRSPSVELVGVKKWVGGNHQGTKQKTHGKGNLDVNKPPVREKNLAQIEPVQKNVKHSLCRLSSWIKATGTASKKGEEKNTKGTFCHKNDDNKGTVIEKKIGIREPLINSPLKLSRREREIDTIKDADKVTVIEPAVAPATKGSKAFNTSKDSPLFSPPPFEPVNRAIFGANTGKPLPKSSAPAVLSASEDGAANANALVKSDKADFTAPSSGRSGVAVAISNPVGLRRDVVKTVDKNLGRSTMDEDKGDTTGLVLSRGKSAPKLLQFVEAADEDPNVDVEMPQWKQGEIPAASPSDHTRKGISAKHSAKATSPLKEEDEQSSKLLKKSNADYNDSTKKSGVAKNNAFASGSNHVTKNPPLRALRLKRQYESPMKKPRVNSSALKAKDQLESSDGAKKPAHYDKSLQSKQAESNGLRAAAAASGRKEPAQTDVVQFSASPPEAALPLWLDGRDRYRRRSSSGDRPRPRHCNRRNPRLEPRTGGKHSGRRHTPKALDREQPKTPEKLSENVRNSLANLPLTNVAVHVPCFAENTSPTLNDMQVVRTLEEMVIAEGNRRRKDPHAIMHPRRAVLFIVCSRARAKHCFALFSKHSDLRVKIYGMGNNNLESPNELGEILAQEHVVITLPTTALEASRRNLDFLKRVLLMVFDVDVHAHDRRIGIDIQRDNDGNTISFAAKRHPCSILMRDFYRALPQYQRPKVLAISSQPLGPMQLPPIEHNLFVKFIPLNVNDSALWKSCYGKGSRESDTLMDVEIMTFRREASFDVRNQERLNRRRSLTKRKSRNETSAMDHLVEEVGPAGVSLYQRRFRQRFTGKRRGRKRSFEMINSLYSQPCNVSLDGLSEKVLSLLSELQLAYAASTEDSLLMATIYAGTPATAGAVKEIICALPVFHGLSVRLVLGARKGNSFETYGRNDNGHQDGMQGSETDDESISMFASGDANILVVAETYCNALQKDPIPPCPLIFRFDDSLPDPLLDGGGGRCRVVNFQEVSKRIFRTEKLERMVKRGNPLKPTTNGRGQGQSSKTDLERETKRRKVESATERRLSFCSGTDSSDEEVTAMEVDHTTTQDLELAEDEDIENVTVYQRRPPRVLLGPKKTAKTQCFLYRIFLREANLDGSVQQQEKMFTRIGVEEFIFVFSERLGKDDELITLQDTTARVGNRSGVAAFAKFCYQGSMTLSPEEVDLARRYTTMLFTITSRDSEAIGGLWDGGFDENGKPTDPSFLRRYLILPACPDESVLEAEEQPKETCEQKRIFRKYFISALEPKKTPLPTAMSRIDWDSVNKCLKAMETRTGINTANTSSGDLERSKWSDLQGSLIVSKLPEERVRLCGLLQYGICPLTIMTRSRKFHLNDNGTFQDSRDLKYLVRVKASAETIAIQAKTTAEEGMNGVDAEQEFETAVDELRPICWDAKAKKLVFTKIVGADRKLDLFDCKRNVRKKRTVWTGRVSYSFEKYYERHSNKSIRYLDQPLLTASMPSFASYNHVLQAVRGTPLSDICEELVNSRPADKVQKVFPEVCERVPLPMGALFLPALLVEMERHLSICELRRSLDVPIGVKGNLSTLRESLTAGHVDTARNYERLEFLGDSLLKLSSTVRLFTHRPHDLEGEMHNARATMVSNDELFKRGATKGVQNYLIFENETVKGYRPPGCDLHGKLIRVTQKHLADVVEAVCGAYFLHGVSSGSPSGGSSSSEYDKVEASHVLQNGRLSPGAIERGYIAGYKFLEEFGVFKGWFAGPNSGNEPTHRQVLLSAIHSMHPPGSPAPLEIDAKAFPVDKRVTHPNEPWENAYGRLEEIIGYRFKRRHLLLLALTHSSHYMNIAKGSMQHQTFQRLEFLGDAVADFCVVCYLFEKYPDLGPGELTTLKSSVVCNEAFGRVCVELGLDSYLIHGSASITEDIKKFKRVITQDQEEGKDQYGGLKQGLGEIAAPKVLADVFESVIGGIFVDSGLQVAWSVGMRLLRDSLRINADPNREDKHPVKELQDMIMRVWKLCREGAWYEVTSISEGGNNLKLATVKILGRKIATGRGSIMRRAKLTAAANALTLLCNKDETSKGAKLLKELRDEAVRRKVAANRMIRRS